MGETSGTVRAGAPPPMPLGFFGFATALMGIAFYLIIEVNVTIQRFFKKKSGLYFWSLLIASWGTCLHTIAFILQWWVPASPWVLSADFGQFGWSFMVTAQSLVLYSRLHLVIRNRNILRGALIMIIITSIAVEVPNWVTSWFALDPQPEVTKLWTPRDNIMLRISQLVLFLQESTLSLLYIWGTIKILAPNEKININRIKWDLVAVNSFIIATDLVNVVLTYTEEHYAKEPIQNFSYAFKLRIEFVVLNQLMAVTSQSRSSNYNCGGRYVKNSGWDRSLSGDASDQRESPNGRRGPSSSGLSPGRPERSLYSMAALAYGKNPNAKMLRHHGSGSSYSGGYEEAYDIEKSELPEKGLSSTSSDNALITKGGNYGPKDLPRSPDVNSGGLNRVMRGGRTPMPNHEDGWWGRLLHLVDPPSEERWRRDLSRV